MIDRTHELPVSRQCRLLDIGRSSYYYQAVPVNQADVDLMRLIDEIHLKYPFYGSRKVRDELKGQGIKVGRGHVRTLMQKMGIEALYQKPRLSEPHPGHKIYPYLLRELEISRANQVWATDICYLPMARGFCYLVAYSGDIGHLIRRNPATQSGGFRPAVPGDSGRPGGAERRWS